MNDTDTLGLSLSTILWLGTFTLKQSMCTSLATRTVGHWMESNERPLTQLLDAGISHVRSSWESTIANNARSAGLNVGRIGNSTH